MGEGCGSYPLSSSCDLLPDSPQARGLTHQKDTLAASQPRVRALSTAGSLFQTMPANKA
jgi:hypothetical protein